MKITLYPLNKIMLDGTEVFLGMEQSDVARAIGEGKNSNKMLLLQWRTCDRLQQL